MITGGGGALGKTKDVLRFAAADWLSVTNDFSFPFLPPAADG